MPPAQYSSCDRGFDSGHRDSQASLGPAIDRKSAPQASSSPRWKKSLAIAVVAIMVATAFIMLAPTAKPPATVPVDDTPAHMQAPGDREVTYTLSNFGESYVKDSRDVDGARGVHGSTPGLSQWWTARKALYSDTITHDAFPYSIAYNPESSYNSWGTSGPTRIPHLAYGTYSFFRFSMDAKNLTTVATGAGKDPLWLPLLAGGPNPENLDGGNVQLNWHFTYLTQSDVNSALAGTSYINTYYGVLPSDLNLGGAYANDGWYVEQKGKMTLDRNAAGKFLGLTGPGSLITQFNTANQRPRPIDPGALNNSWATHLLADGGPDAAYDIFAAYDYSINSGPVLYFLKVDPASTDDSLVLRIWGYSWGMEALMTRYLDVQGVWPNFCYIYPDDWYFNATLTPTGTNIQSRMTSAYFLTTWKDPNWWGPSWMLEAEHNDYNDYSNIWISRFLDYQAYAITWKPLRAQWEPGTNNIGVRSAYWSTPTLWNLATNERLVVKLASGAYMGYVPYQGTVSDVFPKNGGGNDPKVAELNTHKLWGEMVLGTGTFPSSIYSASYYDAATKTLTFQGPTSWTGNMNPEPAYSALYETGSPMFMLDVAKVSAYELSVQGGNPSVPGGYTLVVTAKNVTGATVTDWNGTVNLAVTGSASLGGSTHTFVPGDNGVWTTSLTISGTGHVEISSVDSIFTLDVTYLLPLDIIPEFPSLLVPVMAAAAMIVVFIRRRDKKKSA